MNNLRVYEAAREVPKEAQKPIVGGRLKGKTDINPMWRIKKLTELYGPCGIGWKTEIVRSWTESGANGEIAAFMDINLYIKDGDKWSEPITGTGGSMFIEGERSGLHTNDECFKMAYTDAISVACKMLGFGANIYWQDDKTKYDKPAEPTKAEPKCVKCGFLFQPFTDKNGVEHTAKEAMEMAKKARGGVALCKACYDSK